MRPTAKSLRYERRKRRLVVRYGTGETAFTGYSGNISRSGLMVRAVRVFGPGTILNLEMIIDDVTFRVKGRVRWARKGQIQLLPTGRIGMGVTFVDPPADFLEALGKLDVPSDPVPAS